ncbi:MAG TPA: GNAT family N-acetyltransferase [Solirubrobacterales bacterium]|nr:GNAT family N-acetyltransferase [Solirubrobacterales bacterium]
MSEPVATGVRVREATREDVAAVVDGVEALLLELGGRRPDRAALEAEVTALLDDPAVGVLLVAEAEQDPNAVVPGMRGQLRTVGVLAASWGRAIHVPGRYLTIQDLWTDPDWRSRGVGADLVEAVAAAARAAGVSRIEVGLPRETFAAIAATRGFYERNGFEQLGPRMRRLL